MEITDELRARLAGVEINDLNAVHDLYLEVKKQYINNGGEARFDAQFAEVARRIERAMGLSMRAAQERGELGRYMIGTLLPGMRAVCDLMPSHEATDIYRMGDVTDEVFEEALANCKAKGTVSRASMAAEAQRIGNNEPLRRPKTTPRGRRTMEHMAIQVNAIALGVQELDPFEVAVGDMQETVDRVFEDIGIIRSFLRKVNKNG
jgi:hypothetical protein